MNTYRFVGVNVDTKRDVFGCVDAHDAKEALKRIHLEYSNIVVQDLRDYNGFYNIEIDKDSPFKAGVVVGAIMATLMFFAILGLTMM